MALAVWLAAQDEVDELLDESLRAASALLGCAAHDGDSHGDVAAAGEGDFAWQVVAADGVVLRRSVNAPAAALLPNGARPASAT